MLAQAAQYFLWERTAEGETFMNGPRIVAAATVIALAGLGFGVSACSSSSPTGTATTLTQTQAGQKYVSIVRATTADIATFSGQASGWTNSTTASEAESDAQPVIAAMQASGSQLLALANQYPPASRDIKTEATASTKVLDDLSSISSSSVFTVPSWVQTFSQDLGVLAQADYKVRSDLGYPVG